MWATGLRRAGEVMSGVAVCWAQARAGPLAAMGILLTACLGLPWAHVPGTQNSLHNLL